MNKRSRFILILVVLAVCALFLRPSICWYFCTPNDVQAIALSSLEKIKDESEKKAREEVASLRTKANQNSSATLDKSYSYVVKAAKKAYKVAKKQVPAQMDIAAILSAFSSAGELQSVFENHYRNEYLKAKNFYTNSVKLGLDLSGGMNIIVKADLDAALAKQRETSEVDNPDAFKTQAMTQALETLTASIDKFGLSSPVIRQQGEDRIYIEIPGSADGESVNSIVQGKGILNFRLVDENATNAFAAYYASVGPDAFNEDGSLANPSIIPEDTEVFGYYTKDAYGLDQRIGYIAVKKEVSLDGNHVKSAQVSRDQTTGQTEVNFSLDSEGATIFAEFTGAHVGERLAIVNDNKVKSAATIRQAITGGNVSLSGGFSVEEAQNIQKVLQTSYLEVPLKVESQQIVGASLGKEAIHQGMMALALGLGLVLVFMLVYYLGAGFYAVIAQILNMYIMFSVLSAFNLTLTLSSIAGMILTVGMSVDANVIIFERIKEELAVGKSRAAAIASGFDNAFWAIMDSNITTFIAALFLSQLGTGSIQGFAVSLAIGVCSSVFTALVISRLMFDFNTDVIGQKKISIGWGVKQ
ncbi:protein translocase subunit SecD [Treponema pectinovorum]|uniref:protein translocase subunit SecD n=1 Tax=Treponema pectinovorum TaxID=164 RepID=UPI0011CB084C|nr:protein translocase subunit SecD [Treponema pectinovorum]